MNEVNLSIDGNNFLVINDINGFSYFKIQNGIRISPTANELHIIMEELKKLNNLQYSFEDAKKKITELIKNGEIKNIEELTQYLNQLGITKNKEELIELGKSILESNIAISPVDELREEMINEIKNSLVAGKKLYIDFKVLKMPAGNEYMEISMISQKEGVKYNFPKKTVCFNEEAKHSLLEPIIAEVVLKNKVLYNKYFNVDSLIDYRANYFLNANNKCTISALNIEQDYAKELEKKVLELQSTYGINNEERTDEIQSALSEKNLDKPMQLIRKKEDTNGFVNLISVFAIAEFMSIIFIVLQIILL